VNVVLETIRDLIRARRTDFDLEDCFARGSAGASPSRKTPSRKTPSREMPSPGKPPNLFGVEFFHADGFRFVVRLRSRQIRVFVVPDFFRRLAFNEEQQVRLDAGVRSEDAVRQSHDGVQIAFGQQSFFNRGLHARIVVPNVGGHVDAVQQMRERFFLNALDGTLQQFFVVRRFDMVPQVVDGTDEESAGAAGRVEDRFAELWIDHIDHELSDGSGRVVSAAFPALCRSLRICSYRSPKTWRTSMRLKSRLSVILLITCRSRVPFYLHR